MDQRTLLSEEQSSSNLPQQASNDVVSALPARRADKKVETDEVAVLGERIHREISRMKKSARRDQWLCRIYQFMPLIAFLLLPRLLGEERGQTMVLEITKLQQHPNAAVLGSMIVITLISYFVSTRRWNRCKKMAEILAGHDDTRAVGPLIETITYSSKVKNVKETLIRLLPRLQPEDTSRLNAEQRKLLCTGLESSLPKCAINARAAVQAEHRREMSFRLAALQAFGQIGERSVLPTVEKLASSEAKTADQRRIKEAAQEVLPLLQKRIEQQTNAETLLRAADSSDTGATTLLRATQGSVETPTNHLLQPR